MKYVRGTGEVHVMLVIIVLLCVYVCRGDISVVLCFGISTYSNVQGHAPDHTDRRTKRAKLQERSSEEKEKEREREKERKKERAPVKNMHGGHTPVSSLSLGKYKAAPRQWYASVSKFHASTAKNNTSPPILRMRHAVVDEPGVFFWGECILTPENIHPVFRRYRQGRKSSTSGTS